MSDNQDPIPIDLPALEVLTRLRYELKHPFNSIKGYAGLLSRNESLDEEAHKHTERIHMISVKLLELLQLVDDYIETKSST